MKIQEAEISNPLDQEHKLKTKGVIILTDNRPKATPQKASLPDFRQSAFKQTEVDPMEPYAQLTVQQDEDQMLQALNRKLLQLEERVRKLQRCSQVDQEQPQRVSPEKDKKARRKFVEMERNFKCPFEDCARIYGSETSLRHHLKIKHDALDNGENKENLKRELMKIQE